MTMKTIITLGTTRPKFGRKPLYSDIGPSDCDDLTKQSTMPEYSLPGALGVGVGGCGLGGCGLGGCGLGGCGEVGVGRWR